MHEPRGLIYRLPCNRQGKDGERGFINFPRICGVLSVVLTWMVLVHAPFFGVRHIEVVNNETITSQEIVLASGISRAQTIFGLNRRAIQTAILKNPKIGAVEIIIKYPNRVQLIIHERTLIALIPYNGKFVWIGGDGVMMAITEHQNQLRVPLITGCRLTSPILGEKVKDPNFENVMAIMAHLDDQLRQILIKIDLSRLCLYIQAPGTAEIPVEFGDERQIERKVANLRAILRQVNFRRTTGIDLRVPDIPTVITKN